MTKMQKQTKMQTQEKTQTQEKMQTNNSHKGRRIGIAVLAAALAATLVWLYFHLQTYHSYEVPESGMHEEISNGTYIQFGSGIVRYTGNGISALNTDLEEIWAVPYEMQNPIVDICGGILAVADLEGNQVFIFNKDGQTGTVTAQMPIQALSVAGQGVIAVVMKNETHTMFELYGPDGSELVEGKVSLTDTGYPLALDLSDDGKRLLVSYLKLGNDVSSTVVCYDFSDMATDAAQKKILEETYEGTLIPTVAFLDGTHAAAVGTDRMLFYSGSDLSQTREVVPEGEIKSLLIDDGCIGAVEENLAGEDSYAMVVYGASGRMQHTWTFDEEYQDVSMKDGRIIFRNDARCTIYRTGGRLLFSGSFDTACNCIIPVKGFHQYLVIGTGSAQMIRLKKEADQETETE